MALVSENFLGRPMIEGIYSSGYEMYALRGFYNEWGIICAGG